jgi:hypothetical protein
MYGKNPNCGATTMTTSPLSQLRALEKQKSKLIESAKFELLQKIDKDLRALRDLGFDYALSKKRAHKRVNGKRLSGRPCGICGFATEKPHDARSHRWQKPKAPFSDKELDGRNMRRV